MNYVVILPSNFKKKEPVMPEKVVSVATKFRKGSKVVVCRKTTQKNGISRITLSPGSVISIQKTDKYIDYKGKTRPCYTLVEDVNGRKITGTFTEDFLVEATEKNIKALVNRRKSLERTNSEYKKAVVKFSISLATAVVVIASAIGCTIAHILIPEAVGISMFVVFAISAACMFYFRMVYHELEDKIIYLEDKPQLSEAAGKKALDELSQFKRKNKRPE